MNKKEIFLKRRETYKKYHIPGCTNYYKRPRNAIYISPANGLQHEIKKLEVCYNLRKEGKVFITEAVGNKDSRRVDIVCLDTGQEVEIVDKSLTKKTKEAIDKGKDILVVKV